MTEGIRVEGLIEGEPFELTFDACRSAAEKYHVADVGELVPGRAGAGVRFGALLDRARPSIEALANTRSRRPSPSRSPIATPEP